MVMVGYAPTFVRIVMRDELFFGFSEAGWDAAPIGAQAAEVDTICVRRLLSGLKQRGRLVGDCLVTAGAGPVNGRFHHTEHKSL
jgi:hypothetical protein